MQERPGPGLSDAAQARSAVTARASNGEFLIDQATLPLPEPAKADVGDLLAEPALGPSQPWQLGEVWHTLTWVCQGLLGAYWGRPNEQCSLYSAGAQVPGNGGRGRKGQVRRSRIPLHCGWIERLGQRRRTPAPGLSGDPAARTRLT